MIEAALKELIFLVAIQCYNIESGKLTTAPTKKDGYSATQCNNYCYHSGAFFTFVRMLLASSVGVACRFCTLLH